MLTPTDRSIADSRSVMHHGLITALSSITVSLEGGSARHHAGYVALLTPAVALPAFNAMILTGGSVAEVVSALPVTMSEVESLGLPFGVMTRSGKATEVEEAAERLGLTEVEARPGMVLDSTGLADLGNPDVEVVRAGDAVTLDLAGTTAAAAFSLPPETLGPLYREHFAAQPQASVYVAVADGEPVSTAMAWTAGGSVGIFVVGTPEVHRGRGYGAAVTARAVLDGFAAGATMAWLQASPMGERVYTRMGFRTVETHVLLTRPR